MKNEQDIVVYIYNIITNSNGNVSKEKEGLANMNNKKIIKGIRAFIVIGIIYTSILQVMSHIPEIIAAVITFAILVELVKNKEEKEEC